MCSTPLQLGLPPAVPTKPQGWPITSNKPPPTCSDAPAVIAGQEAPTPEDFSYESPTQQQPCSSKQADDLTTAEEASELVQAIEASNADEIRRQEYESLKAREE